MGINNTRTMFFLILIQHTLGANILYVAPIVSPSHHIWHMALTMGLLERGHTVTMLTHDVNNSPLPMNFTVITMEGFYALMYEMGDPEEFIEESVLAGIAAVYDFVLFSCEYDYNTIGFQTLLQYPEDYKFDLIIFDSNLGSRCYYPLIERFHNPPALIATPFTLPPILSAVFGNHLQTSYVPYYDTHYSNKMNFAERTLNFIYTYADIFYRNYVTIPKENALIEEKFGQYKYSPAELERSISLLLCNSDPILEYPIALPPNIIPVGGLHARPARSLPKDLQTLIDDAKDGVILFSLGTNVRSDHLDLQTRQALLDAFAKLPQLILWKFETNIIEDLPKNVVIRKWLPQNDILGHQNTKLFVCHGGALSTQEAMYHAVPVVGIPFFDDQYMNIGKMTERKIAKYLDRKNLKAEVIYETLNEMLHSDIYKKNMLALSNRYHDQPQTALERGIFWIEYILRHGSAKHMDLPTRDMSIFQFTNLDILLLFILSIAALYFISLFIFRYCRYIITNKTFNIKHSLHNL